MSYWDASALVPLIVAESGTAFAREWLKNDPHVITWALTSVEITSAIERRARERLFNVTDRRRALELLWDFVEDWDEVIDLPAVRQQAHTLLARHHLRAADALQLAAAHLASEGNPRDLDFVCIDGNLSDAAGREGFVVRTWDAVR